MKTSKKLQSGSNPTAPAEIDAHTNVAEGDKASWAVDQEERGYYYNDAHGYEVYVPDDDEKDGSC